MLRGASKKTLGAGVILRSRKLLTLRNQRLLSVDESSVVTVKALDTAPTRNDSPVSIVKLNVLALPATVLVITVLGVIALGRAMTTERE